MQHCDMSHDTHMQTLTQLSWPFSCVMVIHMLGAEHSTLAQRLGTSVLVPVRDAAPTAFLGHRHALHTWKRLPMVPVAKLLAVAQWRRLWVRHAAEHTAAFVLRRPTCALRPRVLAQEVKRASEPPWRSGSACEP